VLKRRGYRGYRATNLIRLNGLQSILEYRHDPSASPSPRIQPQNRCVMSNESFLYGPSSLNDSNFDVLLKTVRDRRPIVLVGAGISCGGGYPDWKGLIREMRTAAQTAADQQKSSKSAIHDLDGRLPMGRTMPTEIKDLGNSDDVLWMAETYKTYLTAKRFHLLLRKLFEPKDPFEVSDAARAIVSLKCHMLTTNYDTYLQRAYTEVNGVQPRIIEWLGKEVSQLFFSLGVQYGVPFLVYLHGRYDQPTKIVLTEREYVRQYVFSGESIRKLFALIITQPVILVGFSMTDPIFDNLFRDVYAHLGWPKMARHFILLREREKGGFDEVEAGRLRDKYGLLPIYYRHSDDFRYLAPVLTAVRNAMEWPTGEESGRSISLAEVPTAMLMAHVKADPTPKKKMRGIDDNDPQKGQWGGQASRDGFCLSARVKAVPGDEDWFRFDLWVKKTVPSADADTVVFYLHPTFPENRVTERFRHGKVHFWDYAYGAFTVGAEVLVAHRRLTTLELDLASLNDAPVEFRTR
jgi:hypothetical protein